MCVRLALTSSIGLLSALLIVPYSIAEHALEEPPSFAHEIRPILSDRCFGCHGPATQESDLRLDTFEGATEWVVEPGDAEASELITRVTLSEEDEMLMPPAHSGKARLTDEEVGLLRRWIASGAEYESHWAFASIRKPTPSAPSRPIDSFLQDRLKDEGLRMRPEADRRTLARRVTLDLTGLPPTPEDVAEFESDAAPGAYERLIDRLLASPRYGEHMARFWLDAVRYADTHGLHLDNYREMWPYRDWVVRAFNGNQPYDEFLVEQIAGDLLPDPTLDQLVATGFNRCHVTTSEGGSIEQEVYTRNVFERVDAYGTVCLGMTLGCAKCHDHKYDPVSQSDYYSLFAFFNSLDGPALDGNRSDHAPVVYAPPQALAEEIEAARERFTRLDERLNESDEALDLAQVKWQAALLQEVAAALAAGTEVTRPEAESESESEGEPEPKGEAESVSEADGGDESNNDSEEPAATENETESQAPRQQAGLLLLGEWSHVGPFKDAKRHLEANAHGPEGEEIDLEKSFERSDRSQVTWSQQISLRDGEQYRGLPGLMVANFLHRVIHSPVEAAVSVRLETDEGARVYLNGKLLHRKGVKPIWDKPELGKGEPFTDRFELTLEPGRNELLVKLLNYTEDCEFEFELIDQPTASIEALRILGIPEADRSEEDRDLLCRLFRRQHDCDSELARLRDKRALAELELVRLERSAPTTLISRERDEPRPAFVLDRGEYDQEGDPVQRRTPPFLPAMPDDLPRNRLGLARWTVSEENPLVARVAVNRLWQQLFGAGLVTTAGDFGSQGAPPSHPELLDWLASDFVESGWDVKRMVKQLVMTTAYRQQSSGPSEIWRTDPKNRLLTRGPRHRLDGETLRDQALAVSGLLVQRLGGAPVKPPQPKGLWNSVAYSGSNTAHFVADDEPHEIYRRSLYTFHKRTAPPPNMLVFDGPTRESCTVQRERTNTPLQALLLMNDPQYVDAARALAARVLREVTTDDSLRAERMFELCTARPPTTDELADLVSAVAEEKAFYTEHADAALALIAVGPDGPGEGVDAAELAAWTLAASTVLNLDEVVTKN